MAPRRKSKNQIFDRRQDVTVLQQQQQQQHQHQHQPVGSSISTNRPLLPVLPDDIWSKILFHAGPLATLNCFQASKSFERHAMKSISNIHVIHFCRLFSSSRTPIVDEVEFKIRAFYNLKSILINSWPFEIVYPDIIAMVTMNVTKKLKKIEIMDTIVTSDALIALLKTCTDLNEISLGAHDFIDDTFLSKFMTFWNTTKRDLKFLKLMNTRCVTDNGIHLVMKIANLKNIYLKNIKNISHITNVSIYNMFNVNIIQCSNLITLDMNCNNINKIQSTTNSNDDDNNEQNNGTYINISQNRSLQMIQFIPFKKENEHIYNIKSLNLSNCSSLCNANFDPSTHNDDGDDDINVDEQEIMHFPYLTEVNLFGLRQLSRRSINDLLFRSKTPNIKQICLNGLSIDNIVLNDLEHLQVVDVSGIESLTILRIERCKNLKSLTIRGVRMLTNVVNGYISIASKCEVIGIEQERLGQLSWMWERGPMFQTLWKVQ